MSKPWHAGARPSCRCCRARRCRAACPPARRCGWVEVGDAPLAGDHVVVVVHELLEHGQHQHDRVLGHRDRVGAAVVGHRHLGLAGGLDVDLVVAGAGELHQLQLGRGAEELVADAVARGAQVVLGVGGGVVELRLGGIDDHQLEAGRKQLARDLHDRGRLLGREDLGHGSLLLGDGGARQAGCSVEASAKAGRTSCAKRRSDAGPPALLSSTYSAPAVAQGLELGGDLVGRAVERAGADRLVRDHALARSCRPGAPSAGRCAGAPRCGSRTPSAARPACSPR